MLELFELESAGIPPPTLETHAIDAVHRRDMPPFGAIVVTQPSRRAPRGWFSTGTAGHGKIELVSSYSLRPSARPDSKQNATQNRGTSEETAERQADADLKAAGKTK
jgi:hypothetical protein